MKYTGLKVVTYTYHLNHPDLFYISLRLMLVIYLFIFNFLFTAGETTWKNFVFSNLDRSLTYGCLHHAAYLRMPGLQFCYATC